MALAGGACGSDPRATIPLGNVAVETVPDYSLAVTLRFSTASAARPTVTVVGPDGERVLPQRAVTSDPDGTVHRADVIGLRPRTEYRFRVGGRHIVADESASFTTGAVPDGFPRIDVHASAPDRMQPGLTLLSLSGLGGGWLIALDASGRPVWYFHPEVNGIIAGVRQLDDGRIAYLTTAWDALHLVDPVTRTETVMLPEQLGLDTIHHEPDLGPDGHLLLLGSELRYVDDGAGGSRALVGDVISEVTLEGAVLAQWHAFDFLAPGRILPDARIPFWNAEYPGIPGLLDWTHLNSVSYVARDDSLVVSSLNQHLLFKLSRAGQLVWVIGEDRGDTAADDAWPWLARAPGGEWPLRQHSVEASRADEHLWIYDNGFDSLVSRASEIVVDERAGAARIAWSWSDPDPRPRIFTPVGGDFDVLANGNRLVYSGLNLELSAALSELDGTTDEKVFDVRFPRNGGFNATRIGSLHPPESGP